VLAGFLLSLFDWWGKDLRDTRLRVAGMPLPSDRVFGRYHWPLAVLGALQGFGLVLALDVSPVWAALSVFAVPALCLLFLVLSALVNGLGLFSPSRARRNFDTSTLVGKDIAEATRIAQENGWQSELVEEPIEPMDTTSPPPARRRPHVVPCLRIGIRDGKVVSVGVAQD
jgi:hypothetical protein